VVREAAVVQRNIRVTAQDATVDEVLTGRQNLVMIGRLSGLRRRQARARAASRAPLRRVMWVQSGVGKGR
jgi:ABC-type Na+ transport system ATPase subunit NatA